MQTIVMPWVELKNPKVAIVHDIFDQFGGAERVVQGLLDIWPQADLFTSRVNHHSPLFQLIPKIPQTTFMQKLPFFPRLAKFYTPLYPLAFESLNLSNYDLIFSSTAHFAKAILTKPTQIHICYCHTPPRFLYHFASETNTRRKWIYQPFVTLVDHWLRKYDFVAGQRPDYFLTNSQTTAQRIQKFYRRSAQVIYPPIETGKFKPLESSQTRKNYFLVVSRLVAYKNVQTVVQAFQQLEDQLVIAGTGPEAAKLQKTASANIEFRGFVSDAELIRLYQNARALIFPVVDEDFGIVPIEAMAAGTPVIAFRSGGVQETVVENQTGLFYDSNTPEVLRKTIQEFKSRENEFDTTQIVNHAQKFTRTRFKQEVEKSVAYAAAELQNRTDIPKDSTTD